MWMKTLCLSRWKNTSHTTRRTFKILFYLHAKCCFLDHKFAAFLPTFAWLARMLKEDNKISWLCCLTNLLWKTFKRVHRGQQTRNEKVFRIQKKLLLLPACSCYFLPWFEILISNFTQRFSFFNFWKMKPKSVLRRF